MGVMQWLGVVAESSLLKREEAAANELMMLPLPSTQMLVVSLCLMMVAAKRGVANPHTKCRYDRCGAQNTLL